MDILTYWANLYNHRTDWAFNAHRKYLQSFSSARIRKFLDVRQDAEVFVAVFGPSQVGKTTLILKLIGVSPEWLPFVGDCLRGGREPGKSSTATATVYARSPDDYFYIRDFSKDGMKKCETDTVFRDRIKNVRTQVEQQLGCEMEPVEVWIPACYFTPSPQNQCTSISIIDLPGFNSSTQEEHAHVNKLIQRYIPSASLIILVDKVIQITRFKHFGINVLDSWRYTPERFRIVLTHSVSANSIQQMISTEIEPKAFRKHIREQFGSTIGDFPASIKVYPLEYGDTWNELLGKDPPVNSSLVDMMDDLIHELRRDILDSTDEYSLIRANMKLYHTVRKMYKDEEDSLDRVSCKIKDQLSNAQERFRRLEALISMVEEHYNILGHALSLMDSECGGQLVQLEPIVELVNPNRSASVLKEFIRRAVSSACSSANELLGTYEDELRAYIEECIPSSLKFSFEPRLPRLRESDLRRLADTDELMIRNYIPIISRINGHWKHDLQAANEIVVRVVEAANDHINRVVSAEQARCKREVETSRKRFALIKERLAKRRDKAQDKTLSLGVKQAQLYSRIDEFHKRQLADLEIATQFRSFLREAFRELWLAVQARVNDKSISAPDKLLHLAYLKTLVKEYEKLMGA